MKQLGAQFEILADEGNMRAAIYLRVSTDEQTTDNQERELRATAERAGHEVVAIQQNSATIKVAHAR
jgi:DNA invertase Pin-like site-specific DNA recombinase